MDKPTLDKFSQPIVDLYTNIEIEMLTNIASLLSTNKELLKKDPEMWKAEKLQWMGMLDKQNLEVLKKSAGLTGAELNRIIIDAGLTGMQESEDDISRMTSSRAKVLNPVPLTKSPIILNLLMAYQTQAANVLNLTNQTLLGQSKQIYIDILNRSALDVSMGVKTNDQALRSVIKQWADQGIPALVNRAGHKLGVEGYVRTVMVSTVNNLTNAMEDARYEEHGIELIEVSSHAGNRPGCRPYAGRIFSLKPDHPKYPYLYDPSVGRIGDPDSLFGINCGHRKYPFVEGQSTRRYTEPSKAKDYKVYKESQQQRAIERSIRKAKTRQQMLTAAGDTEGAKEAGQLVKQRQASMREFINETGRTRRPYREQIHTDKPNTPNEGPKDDMRAAVAANIAKLRNETPKVKTTKVPKQKVTPVVIPKPEVDKIAIKKEVKNIVRKESDYPENMVKKYHKTIDEQLYELNRKNKDGKYDEAIKTMEKRDINDGYYKIEDLNGEETLIQYKPLKNFFVGSDPNDAEITKKDMSIWNEFADQLPDDLKYLNGLDILLTSDLAEEASYLIGEDKMMLRPTMVEWYDTEKENHDASLKSFIKTFYHEMGHRAHNVDEKYGNKWAIKSGLLDNSTIGEDNFAKFRKVVDKYWDSKRRNDIPSTDRWEYPANAKFHYGKGGTKANYYKEMFAEATSVHFENDPSEVMRANGLFPGLMDEIKRIYGDIESIEKIEDIVAVVEQTPEQIATDKFLSLIDEKKISRIMNSKDGIATKRNLQTSISDMLEKAGIKAHTKFHGSEENSFGYVGTNKDTYGKTKTTVLSLKGDDTRKIEYRVKTMFHEFFHANMDKLESTRDSISDWSDWEETFTESAAFYMSKLAGIKHEMTPSYSAKLIRNLPKLKRLKEFKDCVTIEDFGKVAMKYRFSDEFKTTNWGKFSNNLGKSNVRNWNTYVKTNYEAYAEEHRKELIDKIMESYEGKDVKRRDVENSFDTGWRNKEDRFGPAFSQSLSLIMNRIGVK